MHNTGFDVKEFNVLKRDNEESHQIWGLAIFYFIVTASRHPTLSLRTLTPFVANKHRAASMEGVIIPLTISVEIPPEDGRFLQSKES